MSDFDDYEDDGYVAGDFRMIVGQVQLNELEEVERQREREREAAKRLAEEQKSKAMSLMQIAGLKTAKEIEQLAQDKNAQETARTEAEEQKRKEAERERLHAPFPPPNIKHP